jgi:radical SAM protein with 4Fe4S-binding SPASM domain
MDFSFFRRLIDEIVPYPDTILVLHRRGESLLHRKFIDMCHYVKGKFKEIQIATNGTVMNDARSKAIIDSLSFISFSLDVPEAFNRTRVPAKYDKVEANILRFLELNQGRVKTQVSMVRTPETPAEHPELFKKIWLGKVDRIRIYEEHSSDGKFGSLRRDRGLRRPCVMPSYEMLIYCDGKVGHCNHDWDGPPMGDVTHSTIREVWTSHLYEDLRRQHETLNIVGEVCKHCDSWYPVVGRQETGEIVEIS